LAGVKRVGLGFAAPTLRIIRFRVRQMSAIIRLVQTRLEKAGEGGSETAGWEVMRCSIAALATASGADA